MRSKRLHWQGPSEKNSSQDGGKGTLACWSGKWYIRVGQAHFRAIMRIGRFSCLSRDLTLQTILSNGVATVRQTLKRMFSAMAAERAKKRRKLVITPVL